MSSATVEDEQPLLSSTDDNVVVATSAEGAPLEKTVHALMESTDEVEAEVAMVFIRRVFALLVMQYR